MVFEDMAQKQMLPTFLLMLLAGSLPIDTAKNSDCPSQPPQWPPLRFAECFRPLTAVAMTGQVRARGFLKVIFIELRQGEQKILGLFWKRKKLRNPAVKQLRTL